VTLLREAGHQVREKLSCFQSHHVAALFAIWVMLASSLVIVLASASFPWVQDFLFHNVREQLR
jgi:hypothetical protein